MVVLQLKSRLHTLIRHGNSKFFGNPNGSTPKPQQSKLSFGKPRSREAAGKTEPEEGRDTVGDDEVKHVKDEDEDVDVKTNGVEDNFGINGKAAEANSVECEDHMGINDNQAGAGSTSQKESPRSPKRSRAEMKVDEDEDEDEPILKRSRKGRPPKPSPREAKVEKPTKSAKPTKSSKKSDSSETPRTKLQDNNVPNIIVKEEKTSSKSTSKQTKRAEARSGKPTEDDDEDMEGGSAAEYEVDDAESDEDEKPEVAAKAREKVQSALKSSGKDPYPDWKPGEAVPYAALCTTFSLIEMTTKRLAISAHCSLFLRQVLRLTPQDLLPTIQLMINKLAADYAGIELGIGESLIMKAIGETTGRSLQVIKADQNEIGDLGLVAAKSRGNQPTMFKPKPLTVRAVLDGLMAIATTSGGGSQGLKIAGIKKLLSAADASKAGKGIDISKDKGGPSEAKFIIRFLEGKLRLGLAEKTVLVAIAHAMVMHETAQKGDKVPTSEKLAHGEAILKTVYRYIMNHIVLRESLTTMQ